MGYNSGRGLSRFIDQFGYLGLIIFIVIFMAYDYILEKTIEDVKLKKIIWIGTAVLTGFILGFFSFTTGR